MFFFGIGTYYAVKKVRNIIIQNKLNSRKEINKVFLPDYNPNLLEDEKDNSIKYSYNEKEIKRKFDTIKHNIINDKVVLAQTEINQIKMLFLLIQFKYYQIYIY